MMSSGIFAVAGGNRGDQKLVPTRERMCALRLVKSLPSRILDVRVLSVVIGEWRLGVHDYVLGQEIGEVD